jgi:hypothetical protein
VLWKKNFPVLNYIEKVVKKSLKMSQNSTDETGNQS